MHPTDGKGQHDQTKQIAEPAGNKRPQPTDGECECGNAKQQERPQAVWLPAQPSAAPAITTTATRSSSDTSTGSAGGEVGVPVASEARQ